ncbi:HD domain protein [Halobacteriovorax sp. BALOs_7]|nr:HD domain protein [Halobacteriovorax sp. BALOs_7]
MSSMSFNVLIAEPDFELSDIYVLGIENTFQDSNITRVASFKDLKAKLNASGNYHLIISEYFRDGDEDIFSFLDSKSLNIPTLTITSFTEAEFINFERDITYHLKRAHLPKPFSYVSFENIVTELSGPSSFVQSRTAYKKINTEYFLRGTIALCDTYVKLSDSKFVKVIKRGDTFTISQIESYLDRDINYLYINKDDLDEFVVNAGEVSFLKYDPSTPAEHLDIAQKSIMTLKRLVGNYGISEGSMAVVDSYVSNLKKLSQGSVKLKNLLAEREQMTNYLYDHCYLTSILGVEILKQLAWGKKDNIETIILTSVYHDLLLEDESLARISSQGELLKAELSDYDKNIVLSHGRLISETLEKEGINDQNLYEILVNHHERPDGNGFPRGLYAKQIKPLTAVFIVAHELAKKMEEYHYDLEYSEDIAKHMQANFSKDHFEKIVKIVDKILK